MGAISSLQRCRKLGFVDAHQLSVTSLDDPQQQSGFRFRQRVLESQTLQVSRFSSGAPSSPRDFSLGFRVPGLGFPLERAAKVHHPSHAAAVNV